MDPFRWFGRGFLDEHGEPVARRRRSLRRLLPPASVKAMILLWVVALSVLGVMLVVSYVF